MLTPDRDQPPGSSVGISGWALRLYVEDRYGRTVSDEQLDEFADWGLLERQGAGYAPGSKERLIAILAAGAEARLLPRRVLRLRANHDRFPVPAEPLLRAMVKLAPTIRRPMRKLARVEAARAAFAQVIGQRAAARTRRLPQGSTWGELLASAPLGVFDSWATGWYQLASAVLPVYLKGTPHALDDLPIEEQVVLLAVLDLSTPRTTSPPAIEP